MAKPDKRGAVGTHVGDMTGFIEALGQGHGLADAIAEAARGFLLQGTGGKWCAWAAAAGLLVDVANGVVGI